MASNKKLVLTNDSTKNEVLLKERVRELEEEVNSLKKRLDDLRKAKNTTILKREREVLEVGTPFGKRDSKPTIPPVQVPAPKQSQKVPEEFQKKLDDLRRQLEDAEKNHSKSQDLANKKLSEAERDRVREMEELRKNFLAEMEQLQKGLQEEYTCDHEIEIEALRCTVQELQADNAALLVENSDLKDKVNTLVTELSIKEAKWCENEEKLKLELQRSWGEKYKEWMEKTESKIAELQQANTMLRSYLRSKGYNYEELESEEEAD